MLATVACDLALAGLGARAVEQAAPQPPHRPASSPARAAAPRLDRSGRTRIGQASVYANKFGGHTMADGTRMDPQGDNAASKTLPLGTTARVTNLRTGASALVTIRDRGPHVPGRIVDLSPQTANQLGIAHRDGVSKVAVTPLSIPR